MMGLKETKERVEVKNISLDDLVPKDHLIRKIDKAIDLNFIYDKVKNLYSTTGVKSIDPVVLFKIIMIQYIFGIRSMRQTIREIQVNMAYRWYLGYGIDEKIPHFSTFGKNYQRRFEGTPIFEDIFSNIIQEIMNCKFLNSENIFIDGTHIKANANNKKSKNQLVETSVKFYENELQIEIENDRKDHKKKILKPKDSFGVKFTKVSKTDPECGIFHKGEHKKVFAYSVNTACDENNFVLDFEVTPGNIHDSVVFPKLYDSLKRKYSDFKRVVVDAGYKIPAIAKIIFDDGKVPVMPYKRPMTRDGFFKKYEYVYDKFYDCYICPNEQILKYNTTNREGYKEYKSDKKICEKCSFKNKCTESKNSTKVIARHVWEHYIEQAEDVRHTLGTKEIYSLRSQTIERVFADAKELHGMRYTQYRGLAKVKMELTLKFACMNLKKLAIWKWRNEVSSPFFYFLNKKWLFF
ncbi:MAG: IS1182 family transposase [Fusobacteriaceae bacterium]